MQELGDLSISNVFIYVADAVRWDSTPTQIKEKGLTAKTVASSIHTPSSFPSIVSGLHPPQHGCWDFSYRLDKDTPTLFNLPGYSSAFANSADEKFTTKSQKSFVLDTVLNTSVSSLDALETIDPPFVFLERGLGGHAPYGAYDGDGWEYYRERGATSTSTYRNEYQRGIEIDTTHFETQLEVLADRNLLDETLVIYTSDHGELLGEGGCLGHNEPIHPKHVYVPTVMIHPTLEPGSVDGLFRHVDLFPTIAALLNEDVAEYPGQNLTHDEPASHGACFYRRSVASDLPFISGELNYESAWDSNGGYVFPKNGRINRSTILAGTLLKGAKREYMRRHPLSVLSHYLKNSTMYGTPSFDQSDARNYLQELNELPKSVATHSELDEQAKDHLRQLGYLTE